MGNLLKQTRKIKREEAHSTGKYIPHQQTRSFIEKKRSQSWIRRQLSRKMTWDLEQVVALSAATYAIHSTEEPIWNDTVHGPDKSMKEIKSKAEVIEIIPEPREIAPKFSGESSQRSFKDAKDTRIIPEPGEVAPKFSDETSTRSFKDAKDTRIIPEPREVAPKFSDETSPRSFKDAKDTRIIPEPREVAPKFSDETSQRSFKDAKDTRIIPEPRKAAPEFSHETSRQRFKDANDTWIIPEPRKVAPEFSHETSRQRFKDANDTWITPEPRKSPPKLSGETSKRNFNDPDNQELEKARVRDQAMAKPEPSVPKRDRPPTGWSMIQPVETNRDSVRKPGPTDYVADAWTKEEMASIKERYERLRATIDDWEAKKKRKANAKLERTEAKLEKKREAAVERGKMDMRMKGKLDKKRAKAVKKYSGEMARIEEIAAGARAQAEENRRNEEFKVKEKANRIRLTGELPKQCPCC